MTQKSTPDERLMIALYKSAQSKGDLTGPVDLIAAMHVIGRKKIAVYNIVKHLAQANFLKKIDDSTVCLTERGCAFIESQDLHVV